MPTGKTITLTIPETLEGERIDKVLASLLAKTEDSLSRTRIQELISEGQVFVKGKKVLEPKSECEGGMTYTIDLPPLKEMKPEAQAIPLVIVYEDSDLLVIDKPIGLVVHPGAGNYDNTLVNALLAHCGDSLSGIGGVARPGIVHRLDKDTSGLMVVAKNDKAHNALSAQFADRSLSRTYQALVLGTPPQQGEVEAPIGRHPKDRKKMAIISKGKHALTYYKVLKRYPLVSLVECRLATGRTHQIRVHMMHIKYPVIGDPLYGPKRFSGNTKVTTLLKAFPRQALHAVKLEFLHPRTNRAMSFSSKLSKDIASLMKQLERLSSEDE